MKLLLRYLFPTGMYAVRASVLLLVFRLFFGALLFSHGVQKLAGFASLGGGFPDPLHVGSALSLSLAIFGELVCSVCFMLGFLHRLCLLPMAFTMAVACFVVNGGSFAGGGELAFVYLGVFVILFFAGPGRFSLDRVLLDWLRRR